ncbi:MAG: DUF1638 domain-containing protein [Dehalobacterium sp.]
MDRSGDQGQFVIIGKDLEGTRLKLFAGETLEKNYLMLACLILQDEIRAAVAETKVKFPILFIPSNLHLFPDKLREYLQKIIDNLENVDYIMLPMGRCGNGTLGLRSEHAFIVLPKCEDCINLILSDKDIQVERSKYSYFLTDGWLRDENAIHKEFLKTVTKYGREKAAMVMRRIYANYRHFVFLDTGAYCLETAHEKVHDLSEIVEMDIISVEGKCGVLGKMMRLDFDDNFVIVPPGTRVSEKHFAK